MLLGVEFRVHALVGNRAAHVLTWRIRSLFVVPPPPPLSKSLKRTVSIRGNPEWIIVPPPSHHNHFVKTVSTGGNVPTLNPTQGGSPWVPYGVPYCKGLLYIGSREGASKPAQQPKGRRFDTTASAASSQSQRWHLEVLQEALNPKP